MLRKQGCDSGAGCEKGILLKLGATDSSFQSANGCWASFLTLTTSFLPFDFLPASATSTSSNVGSDAVPSRTDSKMEDPALSPTGLKTV